MALLVAIAGLESDPGTLTTEASGA